MWQELNRCMDYNTWGLCVWYLPSAVYERLLLRRRFRLSRYKSTFEKKEVAVFWKIIRGHTCGILVVKKIGMLLDYEELEGDIYTADERVARGEGGSSE